jgi:hypothetical protein
MGALRTVIAVHSHKVGCCVAVLFLNRNLNPYCDECQLQPRVEVVDRIMNCACDKYTGLLWGVKSRISIDEAS